MLTPDTLELVVGTKDFSFKPGQYVTMQMKDKI
jgi:ferredoxin-NADP reductase